MVLPLYFLYTNVFIRFKQIQFVMVFFYALTLMLINCQVSKFVIYLNTSLAGLFLIMFYDYFQNTYLKNRAIRKQRVIDAANGHHQTNTTNAQVIHVQNGTTSSQKAM